jgi:signal transduction histidine kinase
VSVSLVLLFNFSFSQSNEKDSLYKCLKKEQSEEERIKLFLEIAKINFEIQNDTSVLYCEKALELTEGSAKLSNKFNAEIFGTLGEAYENVNKEKSIKYFLESLQLYHKKKDLRMIYEINVRLCIVYTSINELQEAKKHLSEAGKIYEQANFVDKDYQFEFAKSIYWYTAQNFEKASKAYIELISQLEHTDKYRRISQAYLNLGACYYFLNQSDSCVNTCYKALRLDDKYHFMQPAFRINFLNTIAASYLKINRVEDAKKIFNQNIEIARKANINSALIVAYNNYAYSCRLLNEYSESLQALKLAHKLLVNNKYTAERLEIETGIGESLLRLNRVAESIPYIKKALKSAKEIKNIPLLIDNYLNLGDALHNHESVGLYKNALKLSEEHKLYDQAYKCYEKIIENSVNDQKSSEISSYYKNLLVLKDSIFYSTKFKEIQEIETKYETEKKEQQIELLEVNNQNQKLSLEKAEQQRNMVLAGIGLLVLMFVPVGFYARQRNRNKVLEARINSENKECNRIAKELHDGVSGSLTTIRYLLESGTENNSLVENIELVSKEVRGISHKLNMSALANQGIKEAIYDALMLNQFPKDIELGINMPEGFEVKNFEVKINLIRILQELVQNTIKYAQADKVNIRFEQEKQSIKLSYQDNGKGCDMDQISFGNGIRNIKDRVKYIRGAVEFDSQVGSGFYCQIKI